MTTGSPEDDEFARLYDREFTVAAHAAFTIVRSSARAEELAQDAFAAAYARWSHVQSLDRPGAWVRRVAINLAIKDRERRARADRMTVESAWAETVGPDEPGGPDEVREAVAALPRQQRLAVVLFYFHDLPVAEVADSLGCAEATARVHLHRARTTLERAIEGRGGRE
ncbi:MAG: sigma-70 family RNA polymerase sigma factor [Actinomycetota bacterium]